MAEEAGLASRGRKVGFLAVCRQGSAQVAILVILVILVILGFRETPAGSPAG